MTAQSSHLFEFRLNRLLSALPDEQLFGWAPYLDAVELPFGLAICESEHAITHVYFPTTAVLSVQYATLDDGHTEVAVVGSDGLVGMSTVIGCLAASRRTVVQSPGRGYRLPAGLLKDAFDSGGAVLGMVLHYTYALMVQTAQTAVCNRHHSIDQQLCRRLLLELDRLPSGRLLMTHEQLAQLLGVRRESISAAAHKLQQAGVISYQRGHISVLDRQRLERNACECYGVVKLECERALSSPGSRGERIALPMPRLAATPSTGTGGGRPGGVSNVAVAKLG